VLTIMHVIYASRARRMLYTTPYTYIGVICCVIRH